MIIAVIFGLMVLGAVAIVFGPDDSVLFVLGLGCMALVPWLIWWELRRQRKRSSTPPGTRPHDEHERAA